MISAFNLCAAMAPVDPGRIASAVERDTTHAQADASGCSAATIPDMTALIAADASLLALTAALACG